MEILRDENNKPLYEQIRDILFKKIEKGELKPGDRIPSEVELAEMYDVSRITVKNAVLSLVDDGLVYRVPGRGSFISRQDDRQGEGSGRPAGRQAVRRDQLALVLPKLQDDFATGILNGVEEAAAEHGYQLIYRCSSDSQEKECRIIEEIVESGAEGLVIFPVDHQNYNRVILRLTLQNFPIVLVDRYLRGVDTDAVISDNFQAGEEAIRHLFELGHREIAVISIGYEGTVSLEDRIQGVEKALDEYGVPIKRNDWLMDLAPFQDEESNRKNLRKIKGFLQNNPQITAVIATNEVCAQTVLKVAEQLEIDVPETLSIVGFEENTHSFPFKNPLTRIKQTPEKMGRKAVDRLVEKLTNQDGEPKSVVLPVEFVPGETTAECRSH